MIVGSLKVTYCYRKTAHFGCNNRLLAITSCYVCRNSTAPGVDPLTPVESTTCASAGSSKNGLVTL